MKIRIKGNTVRYRLSKTEVEALANTGTLKETTSFLTGTLTYAIHQTDATALSADFDNNTITLHVPQDALQQWAGSQQVGMDHHLPLPDNASLYLLLEKDFKCIDAAITEDQSDYFENPQMTC